MNQRQSVIHWIGAGLSSVPGIRYLAQTDRPLIVWNRTLQKAKDAIGNVDSSTKARVFSQESLESELAPGDVVVSMLPGDWHVPLAKVCIERNAHFVSSSYLTDEMRALNSDASDKGLCLVNEVGLDPGIDHLMAHKLVNAYRNDPAYADDNILSFRSYCGGFPAVANDFRYKFSWSPLGVLKALKSPSRSIREGAEYITQRPWHDIVEHNVHLGHGQETFEAYPNRDSLPFMKDYHFEPDWQVNEFVRGTLRLQGWANAWKNIFNTIEQLEGPSGENTLKEMSKTLWQQYAYSDDEPDRVVLSVELQAQRDDVPVWHQAYAIDAVGNKESSAMGRLVSGTVALAVEAVLDDRIANGVSAAPNDIELIDQWFDKYRQSGDMLNHLDLLKVL